jgi:hypothetical protein
MITHFVPADGTVFGMVGWYQGYVAHMITHVVPANGTVFGMVGLYQGYVVYMITHVVPVNYSLFTVGRYYGMCIYTFSTGQVLHMHYGRPVPHLRSSILSSYSFCLPTTETYFMILIWGYNFGWVGWTHIYVISAGHRVVPLLRPFVHVGGTRCAMIFD